MFDLGDQNKNGSALDISTAAILFAVRGCSWLLSGDWLPIGGQSESGQLKGNL
jgi:hypothetical protein